MKRILAVGVAFLLTSLLVAPCYAAEIQDYGSHELPATTSDKIVTLDDSTLTKVRNLAFTGVDTDALAGDGSWLDTTTLLDAESDPVFVAWDKDYADLINTPTIPDITNYVSKTNTTPYTPTAQYHPATKGYVDATVVGEGGYVAGEGIDITSGVISSTVVDTDTDTLATLIGTEDQQILTWDDTGQTAVWVTPEEITFAGSVSYNSETSTVTGTDNQKIDTFSLVGSTLQISLERDGEELKTVDLSGIGVGSTDASDIDITDSGSYFTGTNVETALQEIGSDIATIEVGSPVTTVPDYSDSACTSGQYAFGTGYVYYCTATNAWDRIALAGWDSPAPSIPALETATIGTDGETLTLVFDKDVYQGSGYNNNQLTLDASTGGANIALTYVSGDESDTHTYTSGVVIQSGETVSFSFDGTANSLETVTGGDLAEITERSVTNSSTVGGEPVVFLDDDFSGNPTDPSSISIVDHTPSSTGGTWQDVAISVSTLNNRLFTSDTSGLVSRNSATSASDDMIVTSTIILQSNQDNRSAGVCGRIDSSGNGYCATVTAAAVGNPPYVAVRKLTSGSLSLLSGSDATNNHLTNTSYQLSLSISGTTITALLANDETSVSSTDSSYSTGKMAGVYLKNTSTYIYNIEATYE